MVCRTEKKSVFIEINVLFGQCQFEADTQFQGKPILRFLFKTLSSQYSVLDKVWNVD